MKQLSEKDCSMISGGGVIANDIAAIGIVAGLVFAPEVTVPMLVSGGIGLGALQADNLGY